MIKPETQGKYLDQESVEEIQREKRERAEERAEMKRRAALNRAAYTVALVAGVGGMVYMILNQLIDLKIGVWLLAAVAAFCGRGTA